MAEERVQRRLAAILAADVVGYSRLMETDEADTLARLKALRREAVDPAIAAFSGRIVKLMGDGTLVEFASAVDAVSCAIEIQKTMDLRYGQAPHGERVQLRIGINIGDVIVEGDDIYGDGVNISARLESIAEPGGICISGKVQEEIAGKIGEAFSDAGDQIVKNIARPIRAWRWSPRALAPPVSEETVLPLPDKPSIAALPFDNMSGDPEQSYFADGITEDIITDLSKVSGLFVIARNSSFAYRDKKSDLRLVCRELGVATILEGSVRKAGNRVRINAQLIDGATGSHLWAERYDRDLEDIFAVQDEVTGEIVAALKVALTSTEKKRREGRAKVNPEAYDYMMRARACAFRFTAQAMNEARALIDRAIAIDPGLAQAYGGLALIHCMEYTNGWNMAGPDHLATAMELAHKAISHDENEPQAYHALALTHMWLRQLDEAERAAERAIELDPNYVGAFTALGSISDFAGRHERAIELLQQALRLDPKYDIAFQFLGRAQLSLKRYDDAEASFQRRLVSAPRSDMTRAYLASLYGHTGRVEQAREIWRELLEINPDFSVERFFRVLPYAVPGPTDHFLDGLRKAGLPEL